MKSFGYIPGKTPIHALMGASKIILTLGLSISAMITFDTRFLVFVIVLALSLFRMAKIKVSDFKPVFFMLVVFFTINNLAIYLFAPEQGVQIYGTRTVLVTFTNRYNITAEQLFYQLNVSLKYFSIVPIAMIFFLTTDPSEFASSLNAIKVNFKVAFAVSLALRYIPDVQRSYKEISQAQQARGIDISKKAPLRKRLSGVLTIVFPLVFSSLDKIEMIGNAMELRGFGRQKKRTWYSSRAFTKNDYIVIGLSILCVLLSVVTLIVNNGRFLNPFV